MLLIAESGQLSLYYYGDQIVAAWDQDDAVSKEQEIEANQIMELYLMEFEGRA